MKVQIAGTYGKSRVFKEVSALPSVGDEWVDKGYEDARVLRITNVNEAISTTTAGDPTMHHTFYRIDVDYDGDVFHEYVVIDGGWDDYDESNN